MKDYNFSSNFFCESYVHAFIADGIDNSSIEVLLIFLQKKMLMK